MICSLFILATLSCGPPAPNIHSAQRAGWDWIGPRETYYELRLPTHPETNRVIKQTTLWACPRADVTTPSKHSACTYHAGLTFRNNPEIGIKGCFTWKGQLRDTCVASFTVTD